MLDSPFVLPEVAFAAASASGEEAVQTHVVVTLILDAARAETVTVDFSADPASTAISPDDYAPSTGQVVFAPLQLTNTIVLGIVNDLLPENNPPETVILNLDNPVNSTVGSISNYTYSILDTDDDLPTVAFETAGASFAEGAFSATIRVTLSKTYAGTTTVDHALAGAGGTATPGDDFVYTNGTLTFLPGSTSEVFTFTVIDDMLDEEDETIVLALSNPVNGFPGSPQTYTYIIISDSNDWYSLPFFEPFEARTPGHLHGQHGWVSRDTMVQTETTYGNSSKAGRITTGNGSLTHTFNDGQTSVWTDLRLQPVFMTAPPTPPTNATFAFYGAAANGHLMAFDGTNPTDTGVVLTEGAWTRFTVYSDYMTRTWDLYVDGTIVANDLNFHNPATASYRKFGIEGGYDNAV
ncbi:MAG: Calx-beta domain-containing protein, partial [Verrucomicrobiota bacterium]